jgi:hypothetical protein
VGGQGEEKKGTPGAHTHPIVRLQHFQRKKGRKGEEEKEEEEEKPQPTKATGQPTTRKTSKLLGVLLKVSLSLFFLRLFGCLFYFSSPYYGPVVTLPGSVSINPPSRIV